MPCPSQLISSDIVWIADIIDFACFFVFDYPCLWYKWAKMRHVKFFGLFPLINEFPCAVERLFQVICLLADVGVIIELLIFLSRQLEWI